MTAVTAGRRRRAFGVGRGALLVALVVCIVGSVTATLVLAYFTNTRAVAASFGSIAIFAGSRTTAAFSVGDSSSGTEVDASNPYAFDDGRTATLGAWSSSFDESRYVDVDVNEPLPSNLVVSSATFHLRFASSAGGDTSCFYAEVRSATSGSVLATYGSSGSPLGCVTGTSASTVSTALPAVSTTDAANDLRIRVYARNSGSSSIVIDRATVTGSTPLVAFTLYPVAVTDAADASPSTWAWPLSAP